ncbi:MAG: neuraminidase-like domain-containing protein [Pseudomonadota bacterium]
MDARLLKELRSSGTLRLGELKASNPELFSALSAGFAAERRQVLDALADGAADNVQSALRSVDAATLASPQAAEAVARALEAAQVEEPVREAIAAAVDASQLFAAQVDDPELPLAAQPAVRAQLARAQLAGMVESAQLDARAFEALSARVAGLDALDDDTLDDLVRGDALSEADARKLGTRVSLYHAAGGDTAAAQLLAATRFAALGREPASARELLQVPESEIAAALAVPGARLPEGAQPAELARNVLARLAEAWPFEALRARLAVPAPERVAASALRIAPLLAREPALLARDADDLDLQEVPEADRAAVRTAHAEVQSLVRRYPGLGLEAAVQGASAAEIGRKVTARLALLDTVVQQNPEAQFMALDYGADSEDMKALKLDGIAPADRKAVVHVLKAQQRVHAVADDPAVTARVLEAGYPSAVDIARDDVEDFARKTGLPMEQARTVHGRASGALAGVSAIVGSMIDVVHGGFDKLGVGNVFEDVSDALRKLDGYADLFGPVDGCDCAHCQSILSPAAYFVDLMYFIGQHVAKKYFSGAKAAHALNLHTRRPDLWTLPLTCENTDTLLPTLVVVNEVLESYIAKRAKPNINLADRKAVTLLVYGDKLPKETASFRMPFVLGAAKADTYLEAFELTRGALAAASGREDTPLHAAAALRLAKQEYQLVVTSNLGQTYLRSLYKVDFDFDGAGAAAPVDVQAMLPFTNLTRAEFGELAASRVVTANGTRHVHIKATKRSADSVQNDVERISGLGVRVLDAMHRMARLWRTLPWTLPELDLVLAQRTPGAAPPLNAAAVADVVAVAGLAARFGLGAEEACALWSPVPRSATAAGRRPLFDSLFNNRPYTLTEGNLPKPAVKFVHPAFRPDLTPRPADNTLQRLFLGMKVSEADLGELIRLLAVPLGANLAAPNPDDRGFALSHLNISLLWRHARLLRLLRRKPAELGQLLAFAGLPAGVDTLPELRKLLEFDDWARTSGWSLDDIAFMTAGQPLAPEKYPAAADIAAAVVDQIAAESALQFADTVFAFVPGVSEDDSRKIVAANAALFDVEPQNLLRLKAATGLAPAIAVPGGVTAAVADLRAVLARHHAANVLAVRLGARLGTSAEKFAALLGVLKLNLATPAFATAAQGGTRTELEAAIARLSRLAVLFRTEDIGAARLAFIGKHLPLFPVANMGALTVANLRALHAYRLLVAPQPPVDEPFAPHALAVEAALAQFTPAQKFAAVAPETLGKAVGLPATSAGTLAALAVLGNAPVAALGRLAALARIARDGGIGADALKLLVSDTATDLDRGAEALVAALRQKYPGDKEFEAALQPLDDRLHGRKRDALADHVIRHGHERFETLDDLYDYFLIDAQMQGCARTSRLVAAISSAQTYVHRVLLNLEQDRRDVGDPGHVHVLPSAIPADEWSWRKNYRVWEANRKVFLWPENYIEPELRDDKTPLFKALEETLLQQDVTEQNVLDAYGAYLSGFEEAAGLRIAGAYHELSAASGTDLLHVFGATNADPPAYYYWTVSNLYYSKFDPDRHVAYSARRKIDVSIPARKVSPIVHLGRLFVFWNEVATSSSNKVEDGASTFIGYKHKLTTKFVSLRLDGAWTPPQVLEPLVDGSIVSSGGVILDPLDYRATYLRLYPKYSHDMVKHRAFQDGYTLGGFEWETIYPARYGDRLITVGAGLRIATQADLFGQRQYRLGPELRSTLKALWGGPRRLLHVGRLGAGRQLFAPQTTTYFGLDVVLPPSALQALVADMDDLQDYLYGQSIWAGYVDSYVEKLALSPNRRGAPLANLRNPSASASAVIGAPGGAGLVIQGPRDAMYVHRVPGATPWQALRLGTTLAREMSRILFTGGVNELLALHTQKKLAEADHLLQPLSQALATRGRVGAIDFSGPMGVYYKEIYFHIPFLIADHLNGRQNFAAAQDWYHYLFDPTATLDPGINLEALSAGQRKKVLRDRVWRYIQFRNMTPPKLRDILTDEASIKAYKEDPFNPHAIARLRISAYQKSVVMKYVANLIDWGDSLFAQFTMESVNEALVLYVMASEILGRPPADVGDCGEGTAVPKNYQTIRPAIDRGSEFLLEAESVYWVGPRAWKFGRAAAKPGKFIDFIRGDAEARLKNAHDTAGLLAKTRAPAPPAPRSVPLEARAMATVGAAAAPAPTELRTGLAENSRLRELAPRGQVGVEYQEAQSVFAAMAAPMLGEAAVSRASAARLGAELGLNVDEATGSEPISHAADWKRTRAVSWTQAKGRTAPVVANDSIGIADHRRAGRFGWSVVRQMGPVFCVPQNKDLAALWARVQDRLYKIRHCLDLDGERRDLALFAPEIDPRLLVRARAEGLSIEDVLGAGSGNLPPYRFAYLIEKARQHAAAVQGFGAQLLSVLEKRDGEELARLRNTQALNMLKLSTRQREWDLKMAEDGLALAEQQIAAAEYRRDYYRGLLDTDLLPWERTQQVLRHGSTAFYTLGALFGGTAGVLSLIPQIGSPFAMKYGGHELGNSFKGWSMCFSDTAKLLDTFAASAGLEASFERRREGWEHQVQLAAKEIKQLEKSRAIARVRVDIAARSLELHQQNIDDQEEIIEFFKDKLTGLGLYTWMSTNLQRIYRQAFNAAQASARLAERAYRFERGDEVTPLLQASYWDASHNGLLAGERLAADLADLDKRFMETNYRPLEIDQSFSLLQLEPAQLLALRQDGECEITIPEHAFDLFYPGHYRRRIKAARITIPCITGPYSNVSATLTLKQSFVRGQPQAGDASLVELPLRHTSTVATSTAQNDAGVFDFSFRDERYMPFEGAGAVSVWSLTLPKSFRPFDYQTINDVILHLSYSAMADGVLRGKVEADNAALETTIAKALTDHPVARVLSLRQDFSSIYQRLVNSAPGTQALLELDERLLPVFIRARTLKVARALLLVRTEAGATAAGTQVKVNGQSIGGFAAAPEFPGWRQADLQAALATGLFGKHTIEIEQAGDLAPNPPVPNDPAACDPARMVDLAVYFEVGL